MCAKFRSVICTPCQPVAPPVFPPALGIRLRATSLCQSCPTYISMCEANIRITSPGWGATPTRLFPDPGRQTITSARENQLATCNGFFTFRSFRTSIPMSSCTTYIYAPHQKQPNGQPALFWILSSSVPRLVYTHCPLAFFIRFSRTVKYFWLAFTKSARTCASGTFTIAVAGGVFKTG